MRLYESISFMDLFVGLSDGEVMERLWHFSRMTKEMRPSHCVDVLVHALLYYSRQKKDKQGTYVDQVKKDKLGTYVDQVIECYLNITCMPTHFKCDVRK